MTVAARGRSSNKAISPETQESRMYLARFTEILNVIAFNHQIAFSSHHPRHPAYILNSQYVPERNEDLQ